MILEKGNMWSVYDQSDLFCITANSSLNNKGELIMGAGIAKQAAHKFANLFKLTGNNISLAKLAGEYISRLCGSYNFYGIIVFGVPRIGLFQTKTYWYTSSTLPLILRSTAKLLDNIETIEKNRAMVGNYKSFRVDLNFPGIGNGRLSKQEVLPIISVLPDNVHVWEYE